MTPDAALWLACMVAEIAALVMALRRHRHAPVVSLLAFAVVADVVVIAGQCAVLQGPQAVLPWAAHVCAAAPAARPFAGLARVVYHVETALVMGWPGALAWATWRVFVGQKNTPPDREIRGRPGSLSPGDGLVGSQATTSPGSRQALDYLAGLYAGAVLGLAALHPLSGARTQLALLGWEAVALAFAVGAIVRGWRRAATERWTVAHGVLLVLVPVEVAVVVIGPFARPNVFSAWSVARMQYGIAFAIVAGLLGVKRAD